MTRQEPTYVVRLYMAGDVNEAKKLLRTACYPPNPGLCVTVEPTTFIYTGGEEAGFVVGLVNYPRFPSTPGELLGAARRLAETLVPALAQWTALLVAQDVTEWISLRPEGQR